MVSVVRSVADTAAYAAAHPEQWLQQLSVSLTEQEHDMLVRAFSVARDMYKEGRLLTGEPIFSHAVSAAAIVADLNLLPDAIAATLLFLTPEFRAEGTQAWLSQTFNPSVAMLVEGADKVRRLTEFVRTAKFDAKEARDRQAETMRKMLLAMVQDIRVVLIKLAWRTQTMHYLTHCPEHVCRKISEETMEVFAPLANRLGVWQLKWELEDLAFRYLEPENYKKIARLLDERRLARIDYIDRVLDILRTQLQKAGIHAEVAGRPKHIYSIWRKMRRKSLDFSELYDIRAVRILVEKVQDCYTVLGLIHSLWQPIPGEFDDYIAHPKSNDYRSLHTAVIGPDDRGIEVQIRTFEMHEHAEFGVAAHWRYKEGGAADGRYEEKISWLRQLLDWREELSDRTELADAFKTELFADTIYVLTPAGRVLALPQGATPIDFAYAIHTDLGHRCRGAKVDGTIVPLSTPLLNGQRVEILASKEGSPSVNWLHEGWVKSHRAITKIRQFIRLQNVDAVRENGRQLFDKAVVRHPQIKPNLTALAEKMGFGHIEEFYVALGHGEVSLRAVDNALESFSPVVPKEDAPEDFVRKSKAKADSGGIIIAGVNDLMTVLARCCKPAPPDPVVGFVTRGRGVSIHRAHCLTLKRLSAEAPERIISADWGEQKNSVFPIDIEVRALNRPGMLRDISDVLLREKLNVIGVNTMSRDLRTRLYFTVEVRGVDNLNRILARVMEVPGVQEARRL